MNKQDEPVIECFNPAGFDLPLSEEMIHNITSAVFHSEGKDYTLIEAVYVDEDEIIRVNQQYLNRNYITDIITFSYNEADEPVEGTLYMCAPRIAEQAAELEQDQTKEFARILIHGVLHLCGYEDTDTANRERMTSLEDTYLKETGF